MNERIYVIRESVVKLTQMLAGRGIQVTQRGVSAYVKADHTGRPVLVNLPYIPDNANDELINAIQGFLDHEVAHILFTDFTLMEAALKKDCGQMLNLIEDSRIERCMTGRFQGAGLNLANTGKFFLDKYTTPKFLEAQKAGNTDSVIGILMVPLIRAMAGQQIFKEYMKDKMSIMAPVYSKIEDLADKIEGATSTADCLELAEEVTKRLKAKPPATPTPKPTPKPTPPPAPIVNDFRRHRSYGKRVGISDFHKRQRLDRAASCWTRLQRCDADSPSRCLRPHGCAASEGLGARHRRSFAGAIFGGPPQRPSAFCELGPPCTRRRPCVSPQARINQQGCSGRAGCRRLRVDEWLQD
jgi:hypothetical protein